MSQSHCQPTAPGGVRPLPASPPQLGLGDSNTDTAITSGAEGQGRRSHWPTARSGGGARARQARRGAGPTLQAERSPSGRERGGLRTNHRPRGRHLPSRAAERRLRHRGGVGAPRRQCDPDRRSLHHTR